MCGCKFNNTTSAIRKTGTAEVYLLQKKQIACVQQSFYDLSSINRSPKSNLIKYVRKVIKPYKFKVRIMDYKIVIFKYKVHPNMQAYADMRNKP